MFEIECADDGFMTGHVTLRRIRGLFSSSSVALVRPPTGDSLVSRIEGTFN